MTATVFDIFTTPSKRGDVVGVPGAAAMKSEMGGEGSGPNVGVDNPWYHRGHKDEAASPVQVSVEGKGRNATIKYGALDPIKASGRTWGKVYEHWLYYGFQQPMRAASAAFMGEVAPPGVPSTSDELGPKPPGFGANVEKVLGIVRTGEIPEGKLLGEGGVRESTRQAQEVVGEAYAAMRAVAKGSPTLFEAYRGMGDVPPDAAVLDLKPGDSFSMPLSSFTADHALADQFSKGTNPTSVMFTLDPGARAAKAPYNIPNRYQETPSGAMEEIPIEYVTQGQFEVVSHEQQGSLHQIHIRQTGVFDPDKHALVASAMGAAPIPLWAWDMGDSFAWLLPKEAVVAGGEMGGEGSGPRPGVDNPWYHRGGKSALTPVGRATAEINKTPLPPLDGPTPQASIDLFAEVRDKALQVPEMAPVVAAAERWMISGSHQIRAWADFYTGRGPAPKQEGLHPYADPKTGLTGDPFIDQAIVIKQEAPTDAKVLLDAVNAAPPSGETLYRGLALDEIPKVGDTFVDPVASWANSSLVASTAAVANNRTDREGNWRENVILVCDNPRALLVTPLNSTKTIEKYDQKGTMGEYLAGGNYTVVSVEKSELPKGSYEGVQPHRVGTGDEPKGWRVTETPDGTRPPPVPVSIVHVTQGDPVALVPAAVAASAASEFVAPVDQAGIPLFADDGSVVEAVVAGGPGSGPRSGQAHPHVGSGVRNVTASDGVVTMSVPPPAFLNKELPKQLDWPSIRAGDDARRTAIASAYDQIPPPPPSEEAVRCYTALRDEIGQQFEHLTKDLGVHVTFQDADPYPDVAHLVEDLRRGELKVLRTETPGLSSGHPFFTNHENDMFRAVHDAFGHGATGRGFDRHGEEAAFQAHREMFSGDAVKALATETRGQNSYLTTRGSFPEQKEGLLPDQFLTAIKSAVGFGATLITADDDNLFDQGRSHHVSMGRWFQ